MNRVVVKSTVSSDGVLHLSLPMGIEAANQEVQITVESPAPVPMSQEEWQERVLSTAGKWQGELNLHER